MPESEDHRQISDLLLRYALGLDGRDPDLVGSCFTDDVRAEYAGVRLSGGRQGVLDYTGAKMDAVVSTMHVVSNVLVRFDGPDAAEVTSYGTVALVERVGGEERVRLRGIRYDDRVVRLDRGWLIDRRRHAPQWECLAPGTGMPAEAFDPVDFH